MTLQYLLTHSEKEDAKLTKPNNCPIFKLQTFSERNQGTSHSK